MTLEVHQEEVTLEVEEEIEGNSISTTFFDFELFTLKMEVRANFLNSL